MIAWSRCALLCVLPFMSAVLGLAGCSTTKDTVIFVTKTSIGIDVDSTPLTANLAYDRIEGYIAPRYPNGEIPPVVASLQGDLGFFTPQISQTYATGVAAITLAGSTPTQKTCANPRMVVDSSKAGEDKKAMFFGTGTTFGFKLGFEATTSMPDSITFGYKRKEYSVIPVGTSTEKTITTDSYPAVIASINVRVKSAAVNDSKTTISDFFATGAAADCLATNPDVYGNFSKLAADGTAPAVNNPNAGKTAGDTGATTTTTTTTTAAPAAAPARPATTTTTTTTGPVVNTDALIRSFK